MKHLIEVLKNDKQLLDNITKLLEIEENPTTRENMVKFLVKQIREYVIPHIGDSIRILEEIKADIANKL
jgi:hypothetical protein